MGKNEIIASFKNQTYETQVSIIDTLLNELHKTSGVTKHQLTELLSRSKAVKNGELPLVSSKKVEQKIKADYGF